MFWSFDDESACYEVDVAHAVCLWLPSSMPQGIPTLIILDAKTGHLVTADGREAVMRAGNDGSRKALFQSWLGTPSNDDDDELDDEFLRILASGPRNPRPPQASGQGTPVAIAFPIVQASACQDGFCQPQWQASQAGGGGGMVTSSPDLAEHHALPIVSSMEDHARLIDDLGFDVPLSEAADASIEMMQDLEFCADAAMDPDEMVDKVGSVLSKYEVPMGLMNKVRRRCIVNGMVEFVVLP